MGATESIALLAASKADLAVARGDLPLPANAESVAILRKNVVVLWSPSGLPPKGSKKSPHRKSRRSPISRDIALASSADPGECHLAACDPD